MTRPTYAFVAVALALTVVLSGALLGPIPGYAQNILDYSALPASLPKAGAAPDVLFVYDASSSMRFLVSDATSKNWSATFVNKGLWDPMTCYVYDSVDARFEVAATKNPLTVGTRCDTMTGGSTTYWDGNFLNWAGMRRFDVAQLPMHGGTCFYLPDPANSRNADLTCKQYGTPLSATVTLIRIFRNSTAGMDNSSTPAVAGSLLPGRIPATVLKGGLAGSWPANIYIHNRGGTAGMQGSFCVDNDADYPIETATTCDLKSTGGVDAGPDSGPEAYVEQGPFFSRLAVDSEPRGVIQEVDSKARFGLSMFSSSHMGYLTVPIGSHQRVTLGSTTVLTAASNTEAMVRAVDEAYFESGTPTNEATYQAIRYLAQLPPAAYSGARYVYGYSPAGALGTTGSGALGTGEQSVLSGSETCPAEYLSPTCGRDPYFYGSNPSPGWASPSAQVPCCQANVILFTDGEADSSSSVPDAFNTYFSSKNGSLLAGYTADLHKLVSMAYWMHTTDLRTGTFSITGETGHALTGVQTATFYSFFMYGDTSGGQHLQDTAKWGGFEDSNGNGLPDLTSEWDKEINATGLPGSDGIPDTYFESLDPNDLKAKFIATLSTIISKSGSGTVASVLASSTTGEGAVYQAFYYPTVPDTSPEVKWAGYMNALFVDQFGNLREDTNQDGKLVYQDDSIIRTRHDGTTGEVKVDRYADANGDGKADSGTCSPCDKTLKDLIPIWEAGKRLALKSSSSRKLLTWVDSNNNGLVDAAEQMAFTTANDTTLMPYLRAASTAEADNIINFIRGDQVSGSRNRQLTVDGSPQVWKLGDIVNSTPTLVGAPRERYDVLYGDAGYTAFFQAYKNRRQVAYVGANDGMLHAVNVGYYHRGDDPSTAAKIEHGWFTRTATDNSSGPLLGDELWGFVPYHLLPQLQWLAQTTYTHVSYVDLKPKATDVRIFCDEGGGAPPSCITGQSTSHPSGWGTILIGGMRLGGSCEVCPSGNGPPLSVTISGTPRKFYSAYFVLDVTDPELDPKLLWVFTDATMGLSTSYPAIARGNPSGDAKTSATNAKWFMVVGSGPTDYVGGSTQTGKLYAIDIKTGPKDPGTGNSLVVTFPTGDASTFMGDPVTLDADLDYRTDSVYAGTIRDTGSTPRWAGAMLRLTTDGGNTNPGAWGIAAGVDRAPTVLLARFPSTGGTQVGPVPSAPSVSLDDSRNVWVFFGTGRYYSASDKVNAETQYFFGVKDPVIFGVCNQASQDCERRDLVNVTNAVVCSECTPGTNQVTDTNNANVTSLLGDSTSSLQGLVQSKNGWFTSLPAAGERDVVGPTVLGGIVFFPTFTPESDVCSGSGSASLYALFYQTGSAWGSSIIGTEASGSNTNVRRNVALGNVGLTSQLALHIGTQGSGSSGSTHAGSGCAGRMTGFLQASTGEVRQLCLSAAFSSWSRYVSWIDQRY
ncbi:MAG: pilus assembly protein [Nitrospiraceae bacterium]